MREPLLSRQQWRERGRLVCVPNEEATDAHLYFDTDVRGARHVFYEYQTAPAEQYQSEREAA
jgi:hypothetical protein